MLLCVDVGNSHTVSGVYDNDDLICTWRLKSDRDRTADELAIRYHTLFQIADITPGKISGFIVSSVVPTLETSWINYGQKYLTKQLTSNIIAVNEKTATGITVTTDNPEEVGADRIVNAAAAYELYGSDLIVIDFGTAITFDCVNSKREYVGGAIMPGIAISLDALAGRTAKLPRIDIETPPPSVIGKTTVTAMRSGILHGYGGMIDRMVDKLSRELSAEPEKVRIIATGGMARLINPYSTVIEAVDELLTLKGLKYIHKRCSTNVA